MNNNYVLPNNLAFQRNNALLAFVSSPNGPFGRKIFDSKLTGFDCIENAENVLPGDYALTGTEQGKVKSVTNSGGILTVVVTYPDTVKPDGVSVQNHILNAVRDVTYKFATTTAAANSPQRAVFQKMDNIGVIFHRAVNTVPPSVVLTIPEIVEGGIDAVLVLKVDGEFYEDAIVESIVNGNPSGISDNTSSIGVVNFENLWTEDDTLSFSVTFTFNGIDYQFTFGPVVVGPAA